MLYYLFRNLEELGVPGSGLWSYISFRSLMAFMIAIVFSWYFGKRFIEFMHNNREKYEEKKFDASIDPVAAKHKYTPSMGGIVIIVAVLVACLLFGRLRNIYLLLMLGTTI